MVGSVHFLDGGGEMAQAIRDYDWSTNELGSPDTWPLALKTAVSMALNSKFPKCIVWGPAFTSIPNDAFLPILGAKPLALGRSFREVWNEAWDQIGPIVIRAYGGEATFIENFPLLIDRFGRTEQAYFTFCYSPIRDDRGVVRGMIDTVIKTTGTVETQRQARLLNGELEHRIKNTLSVVFAIVNQTLQTEDSVKQAREALLHRLDALARAQSFLTRSTFAEADIGDVVHDALAPFRSGVDRFTITGPPVMLSSKQAWTLALAFYELSTNAMKYGALSNDGGKIQVTWSAGRTGTEDAFRLTWSEEGGPPVVEPTRKGFGSRIIERILPQTFSGNATLKHDPSGFRLDLSARMLEVGAGADSQD